ncbi:hypothetical protein H2248_008637 [Termitomyces sp. 'cryptogamus']|nr:hypothetical protein H2248_008637 [Termitomyces sp. 'cryptogamus']
MMLTCGIPFITLKGTVDDWQSILDRIDRTEEFGTEPTEWAGMLRAILSRFVQAFVNIGDDIEFWERTIHEERGSGTYWLGGWISVFCAWNGKGVFFTNSDRSWSFLPEIHWARNLNLDGHLIPRVAEYPDGFAEVDVRVVDNGGKSWDCSILAGHIGISPTGNQLDTIQMAPQWFM